MSVATLAERCAREMARSRRRQSADDTYCFELFRRAVAERDQQAWEAAYSQYWRMVRSWIGPSHPAVEDLTQEVFARFSQRFCPCEFSSRFHHLGGILGFMKVCARNLCINFARKCKREEILMEYLGSIDPPNLSTETQAMNSVFGQELTAYIDSCLQDAKERLVFYLSFELGLKPREIHKMHPDKFASPKEVSRIKERILDRLRRDPTLGAAFGKS